MTTYKYCIVPMCKTTSKTQPEKMFVHVPKDEKRRKQWVQMMKREMISSQATCYVCEDHFDMPNDTENYMEVKMMGGKIRTKPSAAPHIFDCQNKGLLSEKSMSGNRKCKTLVYEIVKKNQSSTSALASSTDTDQIIDSTSVILEKVAAGMDVDENQQSTILPVPTISTQEILEPDSLRNKARCRFRSKKTQVSLKEPANQVCERHFKYCDEEFITFYKEETEETIPVKLQRLKNAATPEITEETIPVKLQRLKNAATPEMFPCCPSESRSTKNAVVSKEGLKPSKSKKRKSPKKPSRKTKSQSVTKSTIAIKQETEEPTFETPSMVMYNAISNKELLPFNGTSCCTENAMEVSHLDSSNVDRTSETTERREKTKKLKSTYAEIAPWADQTELHKLDQSSLLSRESETSQNITEPIFVIKQEPVEELVVDNVQSTEESLPSESGSSFHENLCLSLSSPFLLAGNSDSTNVEEESVTNKPERQRKTKILKSMYAEITPDANQTELRRLDKSSLSSRESEMSQNITHPIIFIKQEPVEEPLLLVVDNVQSVEEPLPSGSGLSFSKNLCMSSSSFLVDKPDSTNEEETSVLIKPERKRKISNLKPDSSNSKHAKLHLPINPSMLSKKASGTKKSSERSISPTENSRKATSDIFLSLSGGSGTNQLPGFRSSKKPGDLFDVFASFIADKLRAMNWDDCAVIVRSILDMVFKAGQGHQSSDEDDEKEINISDSYSNSNPPSDKA